MPQLRICPQIWRIFTPTSVTKTLKKLQKTHSKQKDRVPLGNFHKAVINLERFMLFVFLWQVNYRALVFPLRWIINLSLEIKQSFDTKLCNFSKEAKFYGNSMMKGRKDWAESMQNVSRYLEQLQINSWSIMTFWQNVHCCSSTFLN